MAETGRPRARSYSKAAFYIQLHSIRPRAGELWSLRLERDRLTLLDPEDQEFVTIERDEAARYVRLAYDVFRGRTISFIIVEGLKSYVFHCSKDQLLKLLDWLPQIQSEQVAQEIRYSALAMALYGVLHFLLSGICFWVGGVFLLAAAVAGFFFPKRGILVVNGIVMFIVGVIDLATVSVIDPSAETASLLTQIVEMIVGTVLILWAVQQFSLSSLQHLLRTARIYRDHRASFLPAQSHVVRRIGQWNLGIAMVFGVYFAAVMLSLLFHGDPSMAKGGFMGNVQPFMADIAGFGVMAVFMLISGIVFLRQKLPTYFEAKLSAQVLVCVIGFAVWGFAFSFNHAAPLAFVGRIFYQDNLDVFTRWYVWGTLLVGVILINRGFVMALDAEIEEQRHLAPKPEFDSFDSAQTSARIPPKKKDDDDLVERIVPSESAIWARTAKEQEDRSDEDIFDVVPGKDIKKEPYLGPQIERKKTPAAITSDERGIEEIPPKEPHQLLGQVLVKEGIITEAQLDKALAAQKEESRFLGQVLVEMGFIKQDTMIQFLLKHEQFKISYVSLVDYEIPKNILELIPKEMCLRLKLLPIAKLGRILTVAMVDPLNKNALDEVQRRCPDFGVRPMLCNWGHFKTVTGRIYGQEENEVEELDLQSLGLKKRYLGKAMKPAEPAKIDTPKTDAANKNKSDVLEGWDGGASAEEGVIKDSIWED